MGVVYRARDLAFGRDVAVKFLQDRFPATGPAAERFVEEARITGRLQHPGIPPVHHVGILPNGRPFLVMKLIQGRTLAKALAGPRRDTPGGLLAVFESVCQAVGYAHAHGYVHRDIKPANVMVGEFGEVQVLDWGLARGTRETGGSAGKEDRPAAAAPESSFQPSPSSLTQVGTVMGTPGYMAPEQARGEAVDARADVFALGALLTTILTGQPAFVGTTREALGRAAAGDLAGAYSRLEACGAGPELVALAKRCLAPDRDDRPSDAGQVARAVADLRAAAEERARRAELDRQTAELKATEQRKRRRVLLALAGTLVALVTVSAAGAWWAQRTEAARQRAEFDRDRAAAEAEATSREAKGRDRGRAELTVEATRSAVYELCQRGLWPDAARELDRAAVAVGTDPANADLHARLADTRRDLALAEELERIQLGRAFLWDTPTWENATTRPPSPNAQTEAVLRAAGFDVRAGDVAEIAARIKASPLRGPILAALDLWMFHEYNLEDRIRLWAITTRVGPESWRESLKTHWFTPQLVRRLISTSRPEERTPALYLFVASRLAELGDDPLPYCSEACRRYPSDFLLHYWYGVYLRNRQRYPEAVGMLRTAVALRPQSASLWGWLAYVQWLANDTANGIESARHALGLDPTTESAHVTLVAAFMAQKDWRAAEAACRDGLAHLPTSAELHYRLGIILKNRDRLHEAVAAFREAVRLFPEFTSAYTELASGLERLGDVAAALASLQQAARLLPSLKPRLAATAARYGGKLAASGNWPQAAEVYGLAAANDPNTLAYQLLLGSALRKAGRTTEALPVLREVVRRDPKPQTHRLELAHALALTGDTDAAVLAYHSLPELPPVHHPYRRALGWDICLRQRDLPTGLRLLREAVLLEPTDWMNANDLGCCLRDYDQLEDALVYFREAHKRRPYAGLPLRNAGEVLWRLGRRDEALDAYRRAVRVDPNPQLYWTELAQYASQADDLPTVILANRELVRRNPNDAVSRGRLARALARSGRSEEAVDLYRVPTGPRAVPLPDGGRRGAARGRERPGRESRLQGMVRPQSPGLRPAHGRTRRLPGLAPLRPRRGAKRGRRDTPTPEGRPTAGPGAGPGLARRDARAAAPAVGGLLGRRGRHDRATAAAVRRPAGVSAWGQGRGQGPGKAPGVRVGSTPV